MKANIRLSPLNLEASFDVSIAAAADDDDDDGDDDDD